MNASACLTCYCRRLFSLFELDGRAITKFVAEALSGGEQENELNQLLWSSFTLLLLLGIFSTILLIGFTPLLVKKILNVPGFLIDEGVTSLIFVSLSLPLMLVSAGVHGILAAQQRFDLINLIQIPFGVSNYLFPLLILLLGSNDLTHAVLSIVFARLIVLAVSIRICFHTLPAIKKVARVSLFYMKKVLTFGGWLTVSNIISPLLSFMDRFFIGAVLTLTAVSYYVVPYTTCHKAFTNRGQLWHGSVSAFPFENQDQKTNLDLYRRSLKYISLILIRLIILALFSYDLLDCG